MPLQIGDGTIIPDRALSFENENLKQSLQQANQENTALRSEIAHLKAELHGSEVRCERAVRNLRRYLQPLYAALQAVFGEMDSAFPDDESPSLRVNTKAASVWESWKQKLGGKKSEVIQALLDHGEMNVAQLRVATHSGQQTVYDVTSALFRLGLLNKNGGRYSLKQL